MLDGNTLLFVLAVFLFLAAWAAFIFATGAAFAEAAGAQNSNADGVALGLSLALMIASGALHAYAGTWGWFAWPWVVIALLLAFLIASSDFVRWFRIGAPAVLVAVSAALLIPLFI